MAHIPSVLIDLNVIVDVLQHRDPFYVSSARVLAYAEVGRIDGWVAAHSLTTLFYLLVKDGSIEQARVSIGEMLSFLSVAAIDQRVIERALALPYRDFEDAVQMMAAVEAGLHYLITRNVRDYAAGPLPVLQPSELLALT